MEGPKTKRLKSETNDWIGEILGTNPVIVSSIIKFLNAKDLNRAAIVCKLWEDCVTHEKARRVMIYHFSTTTSTMESEEERRLFGDKLYESFHHFTCEPRIMLVFMTESLTDKSSKYFADYSGDSLNQRAVAQWLRKTKRKLYSLGLCNHFSTLMPRSCEIFLCSAWGVIATEGLLPMEYEDGEGLSTLFLSKWPGVEFTSFRVRFCDQSLSREPLMNICGLKDVKKPKALILFLNGFAEETSSSHLLIDDLIANNPKMAMGGAMVVNYSGPVLDARKAVILGGFVIEGDNVLTRSIVLDSDCRGTEAVQQQFKNLEDFPMIRGRTTAILFTCSGRGQSFHRSENVEAGTFGRMFPGIPLVGLLSNGELGYDSTMEPDKNGKRLWTHSYTSVLLVITFTTPRGASTSAQV